MKKLALSILKSADEKLRSLGHKTHPQIPKSNSYCGAQSTPLLETRSSHQSLHSGSQEIRTSSSQPPDVPPPPVPSLSSSRNRLSQSHDTLPPNTASNPSIPFPDPEEPPPLFPKPQIAKMAERRIQRRDEAESSKRRSRSEGPHGRRRMRNSMHETSSSSKMQYSKPASNGRHSMFAQHLSDDENVVNSGSDSPLSDENEQRWTKNPLMVKKTRRPDRSDKRKSSHNVENGFDHEVRSTNRSRMLQEGPHHSARGKELFIYPVGKTENSPSSQKAKFQRLEENRKKRIDMAVTSDEECSPQLRISRLRQRAMLSSNLLMDQGARDDTHFQGFNNNGLVYRGRTDRKRISASDENRLSKYDDFDLDNIDKDYNTGDYTEEIKVKKGKSDIVLPDYIPVMHSGKNEKQGFGSSEKQVFVTQIDNRGESQPQNRARNIRSQQYSPQTSVKVQNESPRLRSFQEVKSNQPTQLKKAIGRIELSMQSPNGSTDSLDDLIESNIQYLESEIESGKLKRQSGNFSNAKVNSQPQQRVLREPLKQNVSSSVDRVKRSQAQPSYLPEFSVNKSVSKQEPVFHPGASVQQYVGGVQSVAYVTQRKNMSVSGSATYSPYMQRKSYEPPNEISKSDTQLNSLDTQFLPSSQYFPKPKSYAPYPVLNKETGNIMYVQPEDESQTQLGNNNPSSLSLENSGMFSDVEYNIEVSERIKKWEKKLTPFELEEQRKVLNTIKEYESYSDSNQETIPDTPLEIRRELRQLMSPTNNTGVGKLSVNLTKSASSVSDTRINEPSTLTFFEPKVVSSETNLHRIFRVVQDPRSHFMSEPAARVPLQQGRNDDKSVIVSQKPRHVAKQSGQPSQSYTNMALSESELGANMQQSWPPMVVDSDSGIRKSWRMSRYEDEINELKELVSENFRDLRKRFDSDMSETDTKRETSPVQIMPQVIPQKPVVTSPPVTLNLQPVTPPSLRSPVSIRRRVIGQNTSTQDQQQQQLQLQKYEQQQQLLHQQKQQELQQQKQKQLQEQELQYQKKLQEEQQEKQRQLQLKQQQLKQQQIQQQQLQQQQQQLQQQQQQQRQQQQQLQQQQQQQMQQQQQQLQQQQQQKQQQQLQQQQQQKQQQQKQQQSTSPPVSPGCPPLTPKFEKKDSGFRNIPVERKQKVPVVRLEPTAQSQDIWSPNMESSKGLVSIERVKARTLQTIPFSEDPVWKEMEDLTTFEKSTDDVPKDVNFDEIDALLKLATGSMDKSFPSSPAKYSEPSSMSNSYYSDSQRLSATQVPQKRPDLPVHVALTSVATKPAFKTPPIQPLKLKVNQDQKSSSSALDEVLEDIRISLQKKPLSPKLLKNIDTSETNSSQNPSLQSPLTKSSKSFVFPKTEREPQKETLPAIPPVSTVTPGYDNTQNSWPKTQVPKQIADQVANLPYIDPEFTQYPYIINGNYHLDPDLLADKLKKTGLVNDSADELAQANKNRQNRIVNSEHTSANQNMFNIPAVDTPTSQTLDHNTILAQTQPATACQISTVKEQYSHPKSAEKELDQSVGDLKSLAQEVEFKLNQIKSRIVSADEQRLDNILLALRKFAPMTEQTFFNVKFTPNYESEKVNRSKLEDALSELDKMYINLDLEDKSLMDRASRVEETMRSTKPQGDSGASAAATSFAVEFNAKNTGAKVHRKSQIEEVERQTQNEFEDITKSFQVLLEEVAKQCKSVTRESSKYRNRSPPNSEKQQLPVFSSQPPAEEIHQEPQRPQLKVENQRALQDSYNAAIKDLELVAKGSSSQIDTKPVQSSVFVNIDPNLKANQKMNKEGVDRKLSANSVDIALQLEQPKLVQNSLHNQLHSTNAEIKPQMATSLFRETSSSDTQEESQKKDSKSRGAGRFRKRGNIEHRKSMPALTRSIETQTDETQTEPPISVSEMKDKYDEKVKSNLADLSSDSSERSVKRKMSSGMIKMIEIFSSSEDERGRDSKIRHSRSVPDIVALCQEESKTLDISSAKIDKSANALAKGATPRSVKHRNESKLRSKTSLKEEQHLKKLTMPSSSNTKVTAVANEGNETMDSPTTKPPVYPVWKYPGQADSPSPKVKPDRRPFGFDRDFSKAASDNEEKRKRDSVRVGQCDAGVVLRRTRSVGSDHEDEDRPRSFHELMACFEKDPKRLEKIRKSGLRKCASEDSVFTDLVLQKIYYSESDLSKK